MRVTWSKNPQMAKHRGNSMKTRQRPMCVESLESRCLLTAGDLDLTLISVLDVPGGFPHEQGRSVAIQQDGKIVVAGFDSASPFGESAPSGHFVLARYNADGSLDSSFGTGGADGDGRVTTDFGFGGDGIFRVRIQSDGKIVAGGFASNGTNRDFALARYNPDGSLDQTFGGGGKV